MFPTKLVIDTDTQRTFATIWQEDTLKEIAKGRGVRTTLSLGEVHDQCKPETWFMEKLKEIDWLPAIDPTVRKDGTVDINLQNEVFDIVDAIDPKHIPRKNVADAHAIILARQLDAHYVTNDHNALRVSRHRKVPTITAQGTLRLGVQENTITCTDAQEHGNAMVKHKRITGLINKKTCCTDHYND